MIELIKKEVKGFFTSLSGYVILAFFLIANGVFIWVIPGVYNIFDSGVADLQPFFSLAPVLYLFLVPALCMRLFSEERRSGTLELLFTRPVSIASIVLSKYIAGLFFVVSSVVLTLVYPVTLSLIAQPAGYIDTGGIIGSYIGLLFLAAIYVAVGVWASSVTENQVVAFLYGMLLSFLLYSGFDYISEIPTFSDYYNYLIPWGINAHYEPMSRGVIALGDVVYFLSVILFFVLLTIRKFSGRVWKPRYILIALVCINACAEELYFQWDITNDKRYTLSRNTRTLLKGINKSIKADIFLGGALPPGIQRLQDATVGMLEEFRRETGNRLRYEIIDPTEITDVEEKKLFLQYLTARGIMPMELNRTTDDERFQQQIIFPGLVVYDDTTEVSVTLLRHLPGLRAEENINYSVEALEYELTNSLRLLTRKEKKSVAFLTGQGEYPYAEVADIAKILAHYYRVDFLSTDTLGVDIQGYDALIIAGPSQTFTERDKYIIDQYIMHGGRVLWCVDEMKVDHDMLQTQEETYATYQPLNIEDLLFRYGVRINPDVLIDGNSVYIPIVTGVRGATPEYSAVPWYYSPLLMPYRNTPVTNGIQPVRVDYANSIDTVGGEGLKRTVLLASSEYAALLKTPALVSLAITEEKMTRDKFNRKHVPVAVMTEGRFQSFYRYNRRPEEAVSAAFKAESNYNRMIVVSDGDIIRNKVKGTGENQRILPLGYDEYNDKLYGNRDFILNCINMLCDDEGWMELRGRKLSLYLLDKTKLKSEKGYWQMGNILLPLCLLFLGGGAYAVLRKRKYQASSPK